MNDFPFETKRVLANDIEKYKWKIGDHTYGTPYIFEPSYGMLEIGRFCSIASNVTIILGNHSVGVSTYPFRSLFRFWPGAEKAPDDHFSKGGVRIGSDVWIGHGAIILDGVKIEHGAIIAAGSVVTKNVGPYEIWGGNPAKQIKRRMSDINIAKMLKISWWDWPDEKVIENIGSITSQNVEQFIKKFDDIE